jgi:hypothetical protein
VLQRKLLLWELILLGKKPKLVLNLFGSDLSVSNCEAVPSKRPKKCPWESSISKEVPKPPPAGGKFD